MAQQITYERQLEILRYRFRKDEATLKKVTEFEAAVEQINNERFELPNKADRELRELIYSVLSESNYEIRWRLLQAIRTRFGNTWWTERHVRSWVKSHSRAQR
jgi:hypothetical protein